MCTSRAPASRIICTSLTLVVPRTIEIVDQDDALAAHQRRVGVVLELDAEMADFLARLDEGAADIVRADDPELERNTGSLAEADGRRDAAVRHGHDIVGLDRRFT